MTSSQHGPETIRIGVAADEPIRVAGLASVFDQPRREAQSQLAPVVASLPELLAQNDIEYIVVDLHSAPDAFEALETIVRERPDVRGRTAGRARGSPRGWSSSAPNGSTTR